MFVSRPASPPNRVHHHTLTRRARRLAAGLVIVPAAIAGTSLSVTAAEKPATGARSAATASRTAAVSAGLPQVSGAGTSASPRRTTGIFESRTSVRPGAITDGARKRWDRMSLTFGTSTRRAVPGVTAPRKSEAALYSWVATKPTGYRLDVPNGTYKVRLLFVEPSQAPGKRVFDITAQGATRVRGLDIAKRAGLKRGHDVNLTVKVTGGVLQLGFVPRVGETIISGVQVTSTAPVALRDASSQRAITLATTAPHVTRVNRAPLAANSTRVAANLATQVKDNWGGVAATNAFAYNGAFSPVPKGTKRITVGFHNCQKKPRTPSGLYTGAKHFVGVPVPKDALPAKGTDGQLTIYDKSTDQLWEFWKMRRGAKGGWEACWGGRIDKVSKGVGAFPAPYGASASGLTVAAGMITIDEARRGKINHAMNLAIIEAARWDKVSWPANRSDGWSSKPDTLMEGQRIRLDPKVNLDAYNLTPFARMVAEAAQEYGFIITDRSGAVAVSTEDGRAEAARTGHNPWNTLLGGPSYSALKNFPWEHIQVLPKDHGKPRR